MGCDFKLGDEVVCVISADLPFGSGDLPATGLSEGALYTVAAVEICPWDGVPMVRLHETGNYGPDGEDYGYLPVRFRKVERRNDRLSIEAFLTIKPGFEEPKRKAPAKKRERA